MTCQYVEGFAKGAGTGLRPCPEHAVHGVAVDGLSPLRVCRRHARVLCHQWAQHEVIVQ